MQWSKKLKMGAKKLVIFLCFQNFSISQKKNKLHDFMQWSKKLKMGAKKLVIFLCFQNFSISQIYVVKKNFLQVSTKKLGKLVSLTKTFP